MKNIIAIIALAAASAVAQTNRIATETYVGNKINAVVTGQLARVAVSTVTINGETHSVTSNPAWTITAGSSTNTFTVNGRGGLLSTNNAVTLAAGDIGAATLADISAALATNSVTVLTGTNYTEFVKLENGGSLTLWRVVTTGPAWWRYNAEDMGYDDGVVYPAGSNIEWVGFPQNFQPTETPTFSVVNPIGEATVEFFPSGISETKPIWQGTAEDTDTEFTLTPKPDWASTYGSATVTWRSNVTTNLIATFATAADLAAYITQAQSDTRYVSITSGVSTNQTLVNASVTGDLAVDAIRGKTSAGTFIRSLSGAPCASFGLGSGSNVMITNTQSSGYFQHTGELTLNGAGIWTPISQTTNALGKIVTITETNTLGGAVRTNFFSSTLQVLRTGQTTSYAVGDDGYTRSGYEWPNPRFVIQADTNVVLDAATSLYWSRNANMAAGTAWSSNVGTSTWASALLVASNANAIAYGGRTDWRLANFNELLSLTCVNFDGPAVPNTAGTAKWTEGNPFFGVKGAYYWSASTRGGASANAFCVSFSIIAAAVINKTQPDYYVWLCAGP